MKKILIAMGGLGSEFSVSLSSGRHVFENFPQGEYEPIILLMLPDGRICLKRDLSFLNGDGNLLELKDNWEKSSDIYQIGDWQQMLDSSSIESDSSVSPMDSSVGKSEVAVLDVVATAAGC